MGQLEYHVLSSISLSVDDLFKADLDLCRKRAHNAFIRTFEVAGRERNDEGDEGTSSSHDGQEGARTSAAHMVEIGSW